MTWLLVDFTLLQGADEFAQQLREHQRPLQMVGIPALILSVLYVILWAVCWRGRPARGHGLRALWLAVLIFLWIAVAITGARFAGFLESAIPDPEIPLTGRPLFALGVALLYVILWVVRLWRVRKSR